MIAESNQLLPKTENQIFKTTVPIELIWDFFKHNFTETDTHIHITKYLFCKTVYNNNITLFIDSIKEHYYLSKRKYIDRELTYKYFLTIIRQLCNAHNILYSTTLIYNKSSYEIEYFISR